MQGLRRIRYDDQKLIPSWKLIPLESGIRKRDLWDLWKINAANKNLRLCVCVSVHIISHHKNMRKQTLSAAQLRLSPSECLLIHVCILVHVDSVLIAPQLLWEVLAMLSVHRWLWKAPLQWNKPSLSLVSMAWACCLTISEEWSYSTRRFQEQHCCATRTERRRKALCSAFCM